MNKPRLADAIGYIDDELILGAVESGRRPIKWYQTRQNRWGALAACLCLIVASAFLIPYVQYILSTPDIESPAGQGYFNAVVIEVTDGAVLVECTENILGDIPVGNHVKVSTNNISSEPIPELEIGDNIRILYLGKATEKDIIVLETTISIFLLDANGDVIIEKSN